MNEVTAGKILATHSENMFRRSPVGRLTVDDLASARIVRAGSPLNLAAKAMLGMEGTP